MYQRAFPIIKYEKKVRCIYDKDFQVVEGKTLNQCHPAEPVIFLFLSKFLGAFLSICSIAGLPRPYP